MNENMENLEGLPPLPIYHNLWVYWLMKLLTLVLLPFQNTVAGILALVLGIVELYELYAMREVSDGMGRAWRWMVVGLALTFGSLILALLAIGSVLGVLLLLVTVAGLLVMLVSDYHFFSALDELILPRGYDYPTGRIRWCFWLALIAGFAYKILESFSPLLSIVMQIVVQAVIVWLLWQYLQAVKAKEGV